MSSRLLLKCDYQYENVTRRIPERPSHSFSHPSGEKSSVQGQLRLPGSPNFLAGHQNSPRETASPASSLGTNISDQILEFLTGIGESIPSVIATYFRTIDIWLPVISRERIQKEFENIGALPSNDLAALLLCMYLITRIPGNDRNDTMRTSIYLEAKSLHSTLASSGESCLKTTQAGLLLSLYEQGHGMLEAAQMTMAVTSRLGIRMLTDYRKLGLENVQDTELGHLWWGIVIMDR
jgi:hypothetical protein